MTMMMVMYMLQISPITSLTFSFHSCRYLYRISSQGVWLWSCKQNTHMYISKLSQPSAWFNVSYFCIIYCFLFYLLFSVLCAAFLYYALYFGIICVLYLCTVCCISILYIVFLCSLKTVFLYWVLYFCTMYYIFVFCFCILCICHQKNCDIKLLSLNKRWQCSVPFCSLSASRKNHKTSAK